MSSYNRILTALLGLAALPLFLACDEGPTGPEYRDTEWEKEEAVKLTPEWNFVAVGETVRLRATLPGHGDGVGDDGLDEAEKLEWESSNPAVASVDGGEVRGLEPGNVLITADSESYRGLARVTVRDRERYEPEEDGEIE
ncbi:MAG: Ig-like domain-containing protein [Gemmatimonadales bacterium]|jgi:uncharacterized protein YjdB